jgi:hypothetical protein
VTESFEAAAKAPQPFGGGAPAICSFLAVEISGIPSSSASHLPVAPRQNRVILAQNLRTVAADTRCRAGTDPRQQSQVGICSSRTAADIHEQALEGDEETGSR